MEKLGKIRLNLQLFGGRGAKSGTSKSYKIPKEMIDYVKNRDNGNYYIASISPQEFLKITSNDRMIKDIERYSVETYGELNLNELNKGYMSLTIDLNTGQVVSHEGRHRMVLLRNAGYKKAQVIVQSPNANYMNDENPNNNFKHNIGAIELKHQMRKEDYKITLNNLKYIKK